LRRRASNVVAVVVILLGSCGLAWLTIDAIRAYQARSYAQPETP
jgi:hypothetical protein